MPYACRVREGRFLALFPLHLCTVGQSLSNRRAAKCFAVVQYGETDFKSAASPDSAMPPRCAGRDLGVFAGCGGVPIKRISASNPHPKATRWTLPLCIHISSTMAQASSAATQAASAPVWRCMYLCTAARLSQPPKAINWPWLTPRLASLLAQVWRVV